MLEGHCSPTTHVDLVQGPWLCHQILCASKRGFDPRRIGAWPLILSGMDGCASSLQSELCSDLI